MTTDEKQRAGIDYSAIPALLKDAVIKPGDANYLRVKSTFFRSGAPGIVFQVKNTQQVVEALAFARSHSYLPLSIRSGGHGISGRSTNDGGIVIDLSQMNKIEILDEATRLVRIEPGARWMEVAAALAPYGWALTSGDHGGVGVGGLATSGGIGWFARAHGLTIDHLQAVDMVLANGSVVHASEQENQNLFWAVRGAGANFGIVTSFEFQVDMVGNVGWAQLILDASDIAGFLQKWGTILENSPRDLTSFLIINHPRQGQPAIAHVMALVNSDDPQTIANRLQPIAKIAPMYRQQVEITPYASILANAQAGDHDGQGEPASRSGSLKHITSEFAVATARLIQSGVTYFFQIRSIGGAVSDVPVEATAFGSRSANFEVTAAGTSRERLNDAWDSIHHYFSGLYLIFDTDQRSERLQDAFPPKTLERLWELKSRYDPDNLFRDNFNIVPQIKKSGYYE
ncbi:MAG: FAD-binding oxidoreductase [Chloroflexi bacterium]|nr:FAD-binding oxidoreductase [Chloroflexota bacterium]